MWDGDWYCVDFDGVVVTEGMVLVVSSRKRGIE